MQHAGIERKGTGCNVVASDAAGSSQAHPDLWFLRTGRQRRRERACWIACAVVLVPIAECCIRCNSAPLEDMAEGVPELVRVNLNARVPAAPLDHLVDAA